MKARDITYDIPNLGERQLPGRHLQAPSPVARSLPEHIAPSRRRNTSAREASMPAAPS